MLLNKEDLIDSWFSTGNSYCKAILCLLAYQRPKSFSKGSDMILDNSWLVRSNSRNYHHFFPRAYLSNNGIENENSIVNITLVDDYLNKREISDKSPSRYMRKFKKTNPHLKKVMKTHLIDNLQEYGVWSDNYDKFLEKLIDFLGPSSLPRYILALFYSIFLSWEYPFQGPIL